MVLLSDSGQKENDHDFRNASHRTEGREARLRLQALHLQELRVLIG
jgi:hypothetical protein